MELVWEKIITYLETFSSAELSETFLAKDDSGRPVEVTTEDVIVHVLEEEVHHQGDWIAIHWQVGLEPPRMSWK